MAAETYIRRLGERGVDYVFANAGTDFAPIVEALSRPHPGHKLPRFLTVPHENVAMAMAHGYYRIAGKPAAVMVHVTVGTANALCGLINAARDYIPVLLAAGRTPGLRATPQPVVLQAALQDFYVNYTLYVCLQDQERRAIVLDALHASIQDAFNEHGVQIMSPNYVLDPAAPKVVPKAQWFAAPATRQPSPAEAVYMGGAYSNSVAAVPDASGPEK